MCSSYVVVDRQASGNALSSRIERRTSTLLFATFSTMYPLHTPCHFALQAEAKVWLGSAPMGSIFMERSFPHLDPPALYASELGRIRISASSEAEPPIWGPKSRDAQAIASLYRLEGSPRILASSVDVLL